MRIIKVQGPKLVSISVQLKSDLLKQLDELAKEKDLSRQQLINALLRAALDSKLDIPVPVS